MILLLFFIYHFNPVWILVDVLYVSVILFLRIFGVGSKSPRDKYEEYAPSIIC